MPSPGARDGEEGGTEEGRAGDRPDMGTVWSQRAPWSLLLTGTTPTPCRHPGTHVGPSQAAELVLQVAGEVIGFLDGGTRPRVPCAVEGWHCGEVPEHSAQAG